MTENKSVAVPLPENLATIAQADRGSIASHFGKAVTEYQQRVSDTRATMVPLAVSVHRAYETGMVHVGRVSKNNPREEGTMTTADVAAKIECTGSYVTLLRRLGLAVTRYGFGTLGTPEDAGAWALLAHKSGANEAGVAAAIEAPDGTREGVENALRSAFTPDGKKIVKRKADEDKAAPAAERQATEVPGRNLTTALETLDVLMVRVERFVHENGTREQAAAMLDYAARLTAAAGVVTARLDTETKAAAKPATAASPARMARKPRASK